MTTRKFQLLAENLPEQRFLQAIFRQERKASLPEVSSYLLAESAIGAAQLYLLQDPDRPVALVLNEADRDRAADRRREIESFLGRLARPDNFLLTFAIPDVDAWIRADPVVEIARRTNPLLSEDRHKFAANLARELGDHPIGRDAIAARFPEFRELRDFLETSILAMRSSVPA